MSACRQNYHEESEARVNKQINLQMYAMYTYQSMAFHFDRDDVDFHHAHEFFKKSANEQKEHGEELMKFQNQRGGRIVLQDIKKPDKDEWCTLLDAFEAALELEKAINQSFLDLHKTATKHDDPQMCDFIESEFLAEQVETIKQLSGYVTNLKRVGAGLGEYLFDKHHLS